MISDDSVLYTHGKNPGLADGGVSGVVLVLSAARALWATAEAKAMTVWLAAMVNRLAVMSGRQAAQAGTPEAKPAHVPAARVVTGEARRWMTHESG
jgi:hypothetical protein